MEQTLSKKFLKTKILVSNWIIFEEDQAMSRLSNDKNDLILCHTLRTFFFQTRIHQGPVSQRVSELAWT